MKQRWKLSGAYAVRIACLGLAWMSTMWADSFIEKSKKITKEDIVPATTVVATKDLMMLLGGRVRTEYLNLGRSQTFRNDSCLYDNQSVFRLKASWLAGVQQGRRTYDKPAIEAAVKLTHYSYWQDQTRYLPMTEESLVVGSLDNAFIGSHDHENVIPLVFMEDAFVKIHVDPFVKAFASYPTFVQAGMFPYMLGRGIALGTYADGGVPHMGWELNGDADSLEQSPVGIMIHTEICDNLKMELYYSKMSEISATRRQTASPVRFSRLSGDRPERGIDKDRELWSIRFDYDQTDTSWGSFYLQPYMLYARAPEQSIEMPADASTKLFTYGLMLDYKYKNFTFNAEFAANAGHQDMHAIDRNTVILKRDKTDGKVREVFSHVYMAPLAGSFDVGSSSVPTEVQGVTLCDGTLLQKTDGLWYTFNDVEVAAVGAINMPVQDIPGNLSTLKTDLALQKDILNLVNIAHNRRVDGNGKQLVHDDGTPMQAFSLLNPSDNALKIVLGQLPSIVTNGIFESVHNQLSDKRTVVNSNLVGQKRFRKPYRLDLRGFMFVVDAAYEFEQRPFKIATSLHWISGDRYPYNDECDKNYNGFMPLRDYNYVGYDVPMFALLYARVLPRPLNIAYSKYYAYNHYQDASNLRTLGAGITWYPVKKDREKAKLMLNVIGCWNDADLYKWDCKGCPRFADKLTNFAIAGGTLGDNKLPGIRDRLGFSGWESTQKASHFLGVEINVYGEYHLFPNCKLYTINGIFIPGQLYTDLKGQPNRNTRALNVKPGSEGDAIYHSLGDDVAYGFNVGVRFAW